MKVGVGGRFGDFIKPSFIGSFLGVDISHEHYFRHVLAVEENDLGRIGHAIRELYGTIVKVTRCSMHVTSRVPGSLPVFTTDPKGRMVSSGLMEFCSGCFIRCPLRWMNEVAFLQLL